MVGKSRYCEICGVREISKGGFFARFPKDELRCKIWITLVGKEDLIHVPIEKLHELRHVCGDHFERRDFGKTGKRLKKRAYPKLNLSAPPLSEHQLREFPQHVASRQVAHQIHAASLARLPRVPLSTSSTENAQTASAAASTSTSQACLQYGLGIQLDKVQDALRDHNYFKNNDDEEDALTKKAQTPVFGTATTATTIRADLQATCLRIQPDKDESFWRKVAMGTAANPTSTPTPNPNKRKLDQDIASIPAKRLRLAGSSDEQPGSSDTLVIASDNRKKKRANQKTDYKTTKKELLKKLKKVKLS